MKYMLLVYLDEKVMTPAEREDCYVKSAQLARTFIPADTIWTPSPLHLTSTATSVRVREDKRLVTDGPFAETREQLGGYYLIDARNLDEAIAIAERIPAARGAPSRSGPVWRFLVCLRIERWMSI